MKHRAPACRGRGGFTCFKYNIAYTMNRKMFRLLVCGDLMSSRGRLRFGTLTVRLHGVPLRTVADMWRSFANTRFWRDLSRKRDYVMVFEPHPNGHGWHIHFVCNFFVPVRRLSEVASQFGFGVCWMESVDVGGVAYISKYISKSSRIARSEGCKGVRICNVSRSLVPLRDVEVHSPQIDFIRDYWHTCTGSPLLRWLRLSWQWLLSWCPRLEDFPL